MRTLSIPDPSLVVLIGTTGSGKSSFARKHFKPTEVISSDYCRGLVSDDENNQEATKDAFELLHFLASKRLSRGLLTVIDATNVQPEARKPLLALAKEYHTQVIAIVLDLPERICHERNQKRPDRSFGPHVIHNQQMQLRRSIRNLRDEGLRHVHILESVEEIDTVSIERRPLWSNLKHEHGPFDIIGDIHGCFDELKALLEKLGYGLTPAEEEGRPTYDVTPPAGRKVIFLGDLVDRGPNITGVLRLAMRMVASGAALCVPGNHEAKLLRRLHGKNVKLTHGLAETVAQLEAEPPEFRDRVATFIDGLISHYVLDDGKLCVSHAGMNERLMGRASGRVREFALYGETTGEIDEYGLPVRANWAGEYRGRPLVVYGHTPVPYAEWLNGTICVDTGCVFGGKLTALRYPERELVSVPAAREYYAPTKPLLPPGVSMQSAQQAADHLLDLEDVLGKRLISTRLHQNITIREENAAAALEAMSRFAIDPRWLIYLPPTMSPSETSKREGLLEHPADAFGYYAGQGVTRVVCEEKHMGSRVVVVLCRDEAVVRRRFGIEGQGIGVCYTRTGRRFFNDAGLEAGLLERLRTAMERSGLWETLRTDWVCLDAELMPWSAKAQELIRQQYAAVGAAATAALPEAVGALEAAAAGGREVGELLERTRARQEMAAQFVDAYRRYCWPVDSLEDLKLAPFHLLASEGTTYFHRDHLWHMETLATLCRADEALLRATPYQVIDVLEVERQEAGIAWWEALTAKGGEGMVVKPLEFIVHGSRGLVQPAIKCRGREYLRIIYGPEYTAPEHLKRLRSRGLGAKRGLALLEFGLGVEGLERFVQQEPLRRVHECVFGVLALESEPVDPRL